MGKLVPPELKTSPTIKVPASTHLPTGTSVTPPSRLRIAGVSRHWCKYTLRSRYPLLYLPLKVHAHLPNNFFSGPQLRAYTDGVLGTAGLSLLAEPSSILV